MIESIAEQAERNGSECRQDSGRDPAATQAAGPSNPGWSVLDLLILLAKRRLFLLLFAIAVGVAAAIVTLRIPARYTATTAVLPPQPASTGAALLSQMASGSGLAALAGAGLGAKNENDTYIAMFRSRSVEDALIQRFGLRKEYNVTTMSAARAIFEKRSTAVVGLKDGVFRISVDGSSPEQAAALANGYVEEFTKVAAGIAITEAAQRRLFFDRQLEQAKNNLANAEQEWKKAEFEGGTGEPGSPIPARLPDSQDSAARIEGQIAAKEVQMRYSEQAGTESDPETVNLRLQVAALREQLRLLNVDASSGTDVSVPGGKLPQAALDSVKKLREVRYRETIFEAIASQYQMAKLEEARQGAVFQTIDPAAAPDGASYPHRSFSVILFTLLGFALACAAVLVEAAWRALRADPVEGAKLRRLAYALRYGKA